MFGLEFVVIIVVAWLLLGPKQMASLARFLGETYQQVSSTSKEVVRQIDVELARREADQVRAQHQATVPPFDASQPPEAYKRFQQDFPDEKE